MYSLQRMQAPSKYPAILGLDRGAGGAGGVSTYFAAGNGGDGGAGIQFAGAAELINKGSITGGAGGGAGASQYGVPGSVGAGGIGVIGGDLTIINSGKIIGGPFR